MHLNIVILLQVTAVYTVSARYCSLTDLEKCLEPLKRATHGHVKTIVPTWDEENAKEICEAYDLYDRCWMASERDCTETDQLIFKTVEDSFRYLCKDHFDEYLEHRACLSNQRIHTEGEYCNNTYYSQLNSLNPYMSRSKMNSKICGYLSTFVDCIDNAVRSVCGEKAAKWVKGLNEASSRASSEFFDCTKNNIALIIGIVVAVIVALSVMCALCVIWKRQKKQHQLQSANPVVIQAPIGESNPAYSVYPPRGINAGYSSQQVAVGANAGYLPQYTPDGAKAGYPPQQMTVIPPPSTAPPPYENAMK